MTERERTQATARFCGYCGERLPDLGAGATGACPNCRRLFAAPPDRGKGPWDGAGRERGAGGERPGGAGRAGAEWSQGASWSGTAAGDPMVAALSGALIPSAGQVVNGQFLKGFLVFLTCWLVVPYLLGIIDAYITAWNRRGSLPEKGD